ncbi:MAG: DUF1102 domain-containing protein [Haloferacaceae archaeon]
MKRRKLVVGLGSLAAGASVAMGTGALSQTNTKQGVQGQVAADANAYLAVESLATNGEYAEVRNGELRLDFDAVANGGDGLNAGSENWFDRVFAVTNNSRTGDGEPLRVWITDAGRRLEFYEGSGKDLDTLTDSNRSDPLSPGDSLAVGVYVDLRDTALTPGESVDSVLPNEFTVHATDG